MKKFASLSCCELGTARFTDGLTQDTSDLAEFCPRLDQLKRRKFRWIGPVKITLSIGPQPPRSSPRCRIGYRAHLVEKVGRVRFAHRRVQNVWGLNPAALVIAVHQPGERPTRTFSARCEARWQGPESPDLRPVSQRGKKWCVELGRLRPQFDGFCPYSYDPGRRDIVSRPRRRTRPFTEFVVYGFDDRLQNVGGEMHFPAWENNAAAQKDIRTMNDALRVPSIRQKLQS